MKKILITGGTGTIGEAFIKEYYDQYEFCNFSRNEKNIVELNRKFPKVKNILGDISDISALISAFNSFNPDVVIHAAAIKHIDLAEKNPSQAIKSNVIGSQNIVTASLLCNIPLTIGVSTDKACEPEGVYGYTKKLMEKLFEASYTEKNKFVCSRFANVAGSNGSVIPYWKSLVEKKESLKLTDENMNRLMFTKKNSAQLLNKTIELSNSYSESFILSKKMKSVNLYKLAKYMSDQEIEIVGKRPAEKLNEKLISSSETPYTRIIEDDYIMITPSKNNDSNTLSSEYSSLTADFADETYLKDLINQ